MSLTLPQAVDHLRTRLGDQVPSVARWDDADLERAVETALQELSLHLPRKVRSPFTATAGTRDLDLSGLTGLVSVQAVELLPAQWPPDYLSFSLWGATLTVHFDSLPDGTEQVAVFWHGVHTIDGAGSTLDLFAERMLLQGAVGYACRQLAIASSGVVSTGGQAAALQFQRLADRELTLFRQALARHGITGMLRTSAMFVPDNQPIRAQDTDPGP